MIEEKKNSSQLNNSGTDISRNKANDMSNSSMHGGVLSNKSNSNPVEFPTRSMSNASSNIGLGASDFGGGNLNRGSEDENDSLRNINPRSRMQKTGSMRAISNSKHALIGMPQRPTHGRSRGHRGIPQIQREGNNTPNGDNPLNQMNPNGIPPNSAGLKPPMPYIRNKSFVASDKDKLKDGNKTGSIHKLRSLRSSQESNELSKRSDEENKIAVSVNAPPEDTNSKLIKILKLFPTP